MGLLAYGVQDRVNGGLGSVINMELMKDVAALHSQYILFLQQIIKPKIGELFLNRVLLEAGI